MTVDPWTEAVEAFTTDLLDRVFPPDECDLAHADRHMRYGSNMVPDERWNGEVTP